MCLICYKLMVNRQQKHNPYVTHRKGKEVLIISSCIQLNAMTLIPFKRPDSSRFLHSLDLFLHSLDLLSHIKMVRRLPYVTGCVAQQYIWLYDCCTDNSWYGLLFRISSSSDYLPHPYIDYFHTQSSTNVKLKTNPWRYKYFTQIKPQNCSFLSVARVLKKISNSLQTDWTTKNQAITRRRLLISRDNSKIWIFKITFEIRDNLQDRTCMSHVKRRSSQGFINDKTIPLALHVWNEIS